MSDDFQYLDTFNKHKEFILYIFFAKLIGHMNMEILRIIK